MMRGLGIRFQILLITLIPVFLIDVLFTYSNIDSNIERAGEQLQSKGRIIAQQIAGTSEFHLRGGNDAQIRRLLKQSIDHDEIVRATVFDRAGRRVAEALSDKYRVDATPGYVYLRQPIVSQGIELADAIETGAPTARQIETLGWVHLYLSRVQLEQTVRQIIADSIGFFIAILVMAVIVVTVISRRITQPIYRLMAHLKEVETGQLGKLIEPVEGNEIGSVQQGFNRMTQALLANRRHLNQRIQQATQQLNAAITDLEAKNRELGLARDEAQKANRIKSEFLANMSHEIRTPINGIKGFINLLSQSDLDSTQQRYVEIILKSTVDLTNIVNEILDFSKMESGKLHLVDEEFDLYEVIEQTRDILFINVLAKSIDLNLIIYSDTPRRVVGDKLRLKQILLNLVGNAIKFTDEGRVVIRVSMDAESDDDVDLAISIEDTGIGISEADQVRLFQAFSQVESSDNRRFSGTGLGLVISKNLATLMGGDIVMRSQPGVGSEFTLRLPLRRRRESADSAVGAPLRALVFAADELCLMETRTLYERAGVDVESSLIDAVTDAATVRENVHRCLPHVDLLVFDLRHLALDPGALVPPETAGAARVILMHYDPRHDFELETRDLEFVSVVNTSRALAELLRSEGETRATAPAPRESDPVAVKRVLLVDDNQINLKLASELIRLWGHEVTEAEHAEAALRHYRDGEFDLVVLDIQMPDVDGVELLRLMREAKPLEHTPAVALTAHILDGEADRLLESGFDYFLGKPIDEFRFRALLDGAAPPVAASPAESGAGATDCAFDYARSLALAADNVDLLRQILEILERDLPDLRQQLLQAGSAQDGKRLGALAHKLHGVTCYASLPRLRRSILSLQQALAQDVGFEAPELVDAIAAELDAIAEAVATHLRRLRDAAADD